MRTFAWLAVFAAAFLTACTVSPRLTTPPPAEAIVKISVGGGHGTAYHAGNGFYITAAHVVSSWREVTLKDHRGKTQVGEVIWANHAFDVALVHVEDNTVYASLPLSCDPNYVGQEVTIIGNPLKTEFAQSWGRVSGLHLTGLEENWRKLITLDITAAPGVSGAPVISDGKVVGILVAGAVSTRGVFPYTYMVPGEIICHTLARKA